jgi:CRISPR-associated protein Csd1
VLLQRLVADADQILADMPPEMYNLKRVKWVVSLDAQGCLLGCVPQTGDGRRGDRGREMLVPDRVRSGTTPPPVLLADNAKYTLGLPLGDEKSAVRHRWYVELHESAAEALPDTGLSAVLAFLRRWDESEVLLPDDISPEDLLTFLVDGSLLVGDTAVRAWWARNWDGQKSGASGGDSESAHGQCLACGRTNTTIPAYIPFKLKGLPGGQSAGTSLVSINEDVFESYDLARGATSRVCRGCGETLMKCLNALLADERRHMAMGPVVYVYWTSEPTDFDLFSLVQNPDPEVVGHLLGSVHDPRPRDVDATRFNIAALSASSARAVVRDWVDTTGARLTRSLADWFELQRQSDAWGIAGEPRGIWRLAAAAYRDARKEMTADVPQALVRVALMGERMPPGLLPRVVERCRVEHDVTYERAMLIRALLASRHGWKAGEMTELDPYANDAAYHSGRLMAVLEDVQRAALGKVGATVVDKYYGAASAAPASVFGKLIGDAQNHLAKLRREREGLQVILQGTLEEVLARIEAFPRTLTLEKQGMFGLGYYHERAALRAARLKKSDTSAPALSEEE